MPFPSADPSTPGRKTILVFDEYLPFVLQPQVAVDRPENLVASEKANGRYPNIDSPGHTNIIRIPGVGWQMRPKGWDADDFYEADFTDDLIQSQTNGKAELAPSHVEFDLWRQFIDGVYSIGTSASGSLAIQKEIASGDTFSQSLASDQSAYPGPGTADDRATMDRVAKGTEDHLPVEMITFRFCAPGAAYDVGSTLITEYFTGPASHIEGREHQGTGQYSLKCRGNGRAYLFERLEDDSWWSVFNFEYSKRPPQQSMVWITIISDAYDDGEGDFNGSKIIFKTSEQHSFNLIESMVSLATVAIKEEGNLWPTYAVPGGQNGLVVPAPWRIDVRNDVRAVFQVAKHAYPESAVLICNPIRLGIPPQGSTNPLVFDVYALMPAGTDLVVKLHPVNSDGTLGTALTGTETFSDPLLGVQYSFDLTDLVQNYLPIIEYTSDGERTPTVKATNYYRDAVVADPPYTSTEVVYQLDAEVGTVELPQAALVSISIDDQKADPSSERCEIVIDGFAGYLDWMKDRASIPVSIYSEDDEDPPNRILIFRGYVEGVRWIQKVWEESDRFTEYARFTLVALGEWGKAYRVLMPERLTLFDRDAGSQIPATTAIQRLLTMGGYAGLYTVPDLLPKYYAHSADKATVEAGEKCVQVAQEIATDILGGYLMWDISMATLGKWRLLRPRRPNSDPEKPKYQPLVVFRLGHPGAMKLPHTLDPAETYEVDGVDVPVCPVLRGDRYGEIVWATKPPEANSITVVGAGAASGRPSGNLTTSQASDTPMRFFQTMVNPNSINIANDETVWPSLGIDSLPTLTEARIVDGNLPDQASVDWLCLRGYEMLCQGRREVVFRAPLIYITDPDDVLQVRPRRPRFYDPVGLLMPNGDLEIYLIASCDPEWTQDGFQIARYSLVQTSFMVTIGAALPRNQARDSMRRLVNRATGKDARTPLNKSVQIGSAGDHSIIMALAAAPAAPLQDLDPTSPTYGEINWPAGYLDV